MIFTDEEQDQMRNYPTIFYKSMLKLADELEKCQEQIEELKRHDKATQEKLYALDTK